MKIIYLLGIAAVGSIGVAFGGAPKEWKSLGYEGDPGKIIEANGSNVTTEGGALAQLEDWIPVEASKANFEITTELSLPQHPRPWASGAIALKGNEEKTLVLGMVILNEQGKVKAGFYPQQMKECQLELGKPAMLKLQVSEGEQRFKIWNKGCPEPKAWMAISDVSVKRIEGVGVRTYALQGQFSNFNVEQGVVASKPVVSLEQGEVKALFSQEGGVLRSLSLGGQEVPMFRGNLGGPQLTLHLASQGNDGASQTINPMINLKLGKDGSLGGEDTVHGAKVSLNYAVEDEALAVQVQLKNTTNQAMPINSLQLALGIDTNMVSYPQWNTRHFPTFLRCESTHFWGYAMSPLGSIVGIFSPNPVASWHLNYNNGGHRILGMTLDLMQSPPLPPRHPQQSGVLKPGEERSWKVYLARVPNWQQVPAMAARYTGACFGTADRYTGEPGERVHVALAGEGAKVSWAPGQEVAANIEVAKNQAIVTLPEKPGVYRLNVANSAGRVSEMTLSVRHPWSWYLDKSREWAVKAKQKAGSHIEGWYGFFPAFRWSLFKPDPELDEQLNRDFEELFATMYDPTTKRPLPASHPNRIQNHAGAAALYALRYRLKGGDAMDYALELFNYIMKTQSADGAYRAGSIHDTSKIVPGTIHYTCVVYVAKFLMEVMEIERELWGNLPDSEMKANYDRQYVSVKRAMDELTKSLDNIETEGEMTFEDGMISCSYTQLAQWARSFAAPEERDRYIKAAEFMLMKHRCLSQLVQPDCRMNNCSLRFWESQYDVLSCPNLMSSPHGWSAWRLYGLFDLYRLTGKIDYLRQAMNGIGACANLIDPLTGELHWAFMVDPRIETSWFVPDEQRPGKGKFVPKTLGELPIPMISNWWRAPKSTPVFGYGTGPDAQGGSCDNDVHEIFKCIAEHVAPTAWVYVDKDGNVEIWNGKIVQSKRVPVAGHAKEALYIEVLPSEACVFEIHVNAEVPVVVSVIDPTSKRACFTSTSGFSPEERLVSLARNPWGYETSAWKRYLDAKGPRPQETLKRQKNTVKPQ